MPHIIYEYQTEDGGTVAIETTESQPSTSPMRGGSRDSADKDTEIRRVNVSFEKALGTVKAAAGGLMQVIRETAPDEAQVEFSVKVSGETGFFTICRAETAAEFKITLKWKTPDTPNS